MNPDEQYQADCEAVEREYQQARAQSEAMFPGLWAHIHQTVNSTH